MAKNQNELGGRDGSPFTAPPDSGWVWPILMTALGAAAIAVGARVTVPFEPVPMTLQTLAVLGVSGLLGARIGACSAALYLLLILLGAPLLSGGSAAPGPAFLDLKSGGYVVGFLPAAFVASFSSRGLWQSLPVMILAHVVILSLGYAWLAHFIGWEPAFEHGVRPFVWGALVKSFVAAALVQHFVQRRRPR